MFKLATYTSVIGLCLATQALSGSFGDDRGDLAADHTRAGRSVVRFHYSGSGVQVCPGVFLTNAHVGLGTKTFGLVPYSQKSTFKPDQKDFQVKLLGDLKPKVVSGFEIRDFSSDDKRERSRADFAFAKVNPKRMDIRLRALGTGFSSNDYTPVLNIDPRSIEMLQKSGDLKVVLPRRISTHETHYPYRATNGCDVKQIDEKIFGHSCRIHGGDSGSPMIGEFAGAQYVIGVFFGGHTDYFDIGTFKQHPSRHLSIASSSFCDIYQKMCGIPCVTIDSLANPDLNADRYVVHRVQENLAKLGFDVGPADGIMGNKTRTGIVAFWSEKDIDSDGDITKDLLSALSIQ